MSKQRPVDYIEQVGITTDGKAVVSGLWKMYETHGLPLDILLDLCSRKNWIPSWIHLYKDMRSSGMKHSRIISKLQSDMHDAAYNKDLCAQVISKLEQIFNPQETP